MDINQQVWSVMPKFKAWIYGINYFYTKENVI